MTNSGFKPGEGWRKGKPNGNGGAPLPPPENLGAGGPPARPSRPRWEYQWEDSLNSVNERAVEPPLADRIAGELVRASVAGSPDVLIFVRGELGIGKTTLAELLVEELQATAETRRAAAAWIANSLLRCAVLEAGDLESPIDFASRVNTALDDERSAVVLARPGTLEATGQWVRKPPDATVTMRTFEPTSPVFHGCLEEVARLSELSTPKQRESLAALASRLPPFLQTPFYFLQIANAIKTAAGVEESGDRTPLELFRQSLERRLGRAGIFKDLVDCALGRKNPEDVEPLAGILDSNGFHHDGYRNVVLAVAVLNGQEPFATLVRARNALPAVRILLHHIEHLWRSPRRPAHEDTLLSELREFVLEEPDFAQVLYSVYVQGLIGATFRRLRDDEPAATVRARCLRLVAERSGHGTPGRPLASDALWWDVSDALSLVGDPRLQKARATRFAPDSGYFTPIPHTLVEIGSDFVPERRDAAKPVLPFRRASVNIGPLWVANFLVTNEQFREFWSDPDHEQFFLATGAQWVQRDRALMEDIDASFTVAARRCFWKEIAEQQSVALSGASKGTIAILDLARLRALRQRRAALWDPNTADNRFSADGNPVVGVTWWEAMAFCAWWTDRKLPAAGFPPGARGSLLTDWEWEAVRRMFYEDPSFLDGPRVPVGRYPAHLRTPAAVQGGRVNNVMRPLHVGLAPVPRGPGPFDMVGNVWEWTRSRVFGRIVAASKVDEVFGDTDWDDVDAGAEATPDHPARDVVDQLNDLSYRAVRGGSFFSIDEQAAWHPAYRLCDPPFSSYFDLGFRFAVYPEEHAP